ncbi:MAG: T9SS type A sorting domain-containing protein [Ignavibacteriae bacterium]|nr:T9SS type A sorting domain-containing protein [Ignavibacteriota bacterium]
MKYLLLIFIILFFFTLYSFAQTDTLVISLKNNQVEKISLSQVQKIQCENITGIDEYRNFKSNLIISGNYPNPFLKLTSIEFESASSGNVIVTIYDNSGSQVQKLECTDCQPGKNILQWNGLDNNNNQVQSGVYFYEVKFNNEVQSKKMILIK